MIISVGCDHGGLEHKNAIAEAVKNAGHEVIDHGIYEPEPIDYPIIAQKVALSIKEGAAELGILVCGTGIGMSLAANKISGIRAAAVSDHFSAKYTRLHNNSNILCLGGRVIGIGTALELTELFVNTEFEGGRHQKRLDLIAEIENKY